MHSRGEHDLPSWDADPGGDPEEDPGDEIEATIERAEAPFASEAWGTTSEEAEEGEPLDQRLAEERPERGADEDFVALEDETGGDEELFGDSSGGNDPFVAPEEAALRIRSRAPGAVDHPPDPAVEEE